MFSGGCTYTFLLGIYEGVGLRFRVGVCLALVNTARRVVISNGRPRGVPLYSWPTFTSFFDQTSADGHILCFRRFLSETTKGLNQWESER